MKTFKLPQNLGDAILNYLATKPWIEVKDLIEALQNLEEIKDNQTKK